MPKPGRLLMSPTITVIARTVTGSAIVKAYPGRLARRGHRQGLGLASVPSVRAVPSIRPPLDVHGD